MKKNILAIAILAAVIADIILTAVMLFSVVPAAKQSNELIKTICQIIDIELENPDAEAFAKIPLNAREAISITGESSLTVPIKKANPDDKNQPYAMVDFSIVFYNQSKDYKGISADLEKQKPMLNAHLSDLVSQYTAAGLIENKSALEAEMLAYCRSYFGTSDGVIDVIIAIKTT